MAASDALGCFCPAQELSAGPAHKWISGAPKQRLGCLIREMGSLPIHRGLVCGDRSLRAARLSSGVAIKNVTPNDFEMSGEHQLVFNGILDLLDFQFLSTDRATEHLLDNFGRAILDIGLRAFRKRMILADGVAGLEGAFDGEENAGFVELFEATISFSDKELFAAQGVDFLHFQLIQRNIHTLIAFHISSPSTHVVSDQFRTTTL